MKPIDKEIFELHNSLRENPKLMVADLEEMIPKYKNDLDFRRGDGRPTIRTKEGVEAVEDAIAFLK